MTSSGASIFISCISDSPLLVLTLILHTSFHCRAALLGHLVDKIQSSGNPDVVIEGARILAENPDVGLSAAFLRAALVDALAIGRLDLGQVCRAAQVLIGADSHQGSNSL